MAHLKIMVESVTNHYAAPQMAQHSRTGGFETRSVGQITWINSGNPCSIVINPLTRLDKRIHENITMIVDLHINQISD
jgi:hypothetical protein